MPRSPTKKPPEPIFWADECLGHQFVSTLRVGGLRVEANVFPLGTPDTIWIPTVANNNWIAITKDHLKSDLAEQVALVLHGAKCFVLIGEGKQRDLADLFLRKLKWIRRLIAASEGAFLGKIYVHGERREVVTHWDLMPQSKRRWGR